MGITPTQKSVIGQYVNGRNAKDDFLQLATNNGGTVFGWIDSDGILRGTFAGGGGTPGGSNKQVQFNNSGAFGADIGLTYDSPTQALGGMIGLYANPTLASTPTLSVVQVGAAGVTSYSYVVVAVKGNFTPISSLVVNTATGNATLNVTNYNSLTWSAVPGATAYNVYRYNASVSPATVGAIAKNITALTLHDTGIAFLDTTDPYPTQRWNHNGYVGIQNGLVVGPTWSDMSSKVVTQFVSPQQSFNAFGRASTASINTILDYRDPSIYTETGLTINVDGYTNGGLANPVYGIGLGINIIGKSDPSGFSQTNGVQLVNLFEVALGHTTTGTISSYYGAIYASGGGNISGSEGLLNFVSTIDNALTGTIGQSQNYTAELGTVSGVITSHYGYQIGQFSVSGGGIVHNAYGFANRQSLAAADTFSASFYSVDQGTAAGHWQIYTEAGTPSSLGGPLNLRGNGAASTYPLTITSQNTGAANVGSACIQLQNTSGTTPSYIIKTTTDDLLIRTDSLSITAHSMISMRASGTLDFLSPNCGNLTMYNGGAPAPFGPNCLVFNSFRTGSNPHGFGVKSDSQPQAIILNIDDTSIGFWGSTSGTAYIGVAAAAGTPSKLLLPTASGASGQVLVTDGGTPQQLSWETVAGTGTVTSVGMVGDGVIFNATVTNSPVTAAGNLTPVLLTQTANKVLAGPTSGGAVTPSFRALVAADIPAIAASSLTNGVTGSGAVVLAVSPALTGSPTAPTQISSDNTTKVATTAFVQSVALTAGAVTSVFGRAGVVTAVSGDYSFSLISGTVAASQLPNPSASTLGGIQSALAVSHQWIDSISTSGVPHLSQPSSTDLSDGTTGTGTVVRSVSPTLTGTPVAPTATVTDNSTTIATTAYVRAQKYAATFGSTTSLAITGGTHNLGTADLIFAVYDSATGTRNIVIPNTISVDSTTFNVTITFSVAQAGRVVISAV